MIIDGVGLALILACTVFDTYEMWHFIFKHQIAYNPISIIVWFTGHVSQMAGLVFLIYHP